MNTSLTFKQQSNYDGFPKAAELIEIEGAHALEASDRAMFNQLLQTAHDSGRLTEPDAEWEISRRAAARFHQAREQRPHPGQPEAAATYGGTRDIHFGAHRTVTHDGNAPA